MKRSSLRFRILALLLASSIFTMLLLACAINWIFERSLERSLDAHLGAYTDVVIDNIILENGELRIKKEASLLHSIRRQWQIASSGKVLAKSDNLAGEFPLLPEVPGKLTRLHYLQPNGSELLAVQNSFLFPQGRLLSVTFGLEKEIAEKYLQQEKDYLKAPLYKLIAVVLILLTALAFVVSYIATRPISRLHKEVSLLREGKENRIKASFPLEIAALTDELNRLLDALSKARYLGCAPKSGR